MAKYKRKPDYIDAVKWNGSNIQQIQKFIEGHDRTVVLMATNSLAFTGPMGNEYLCIGDYVAIKNGKVKHYTKDWFEDKYKIVYEG